MTPENGEGRHLEHVLVIEDDSSWAGIYKRTLEGRGIQVTTATGSTEALALLEDGKFDRIITDGLEGGWLEIATRAQEIGLPVKLISGDMRHKGQAEQMNVQFVNKIEVPKLRSEL